MGTHPIFESDFDSNRMSSTFKKSQKAAARPHRERAQPGFRKHLGLLEKKKDYKLRANNFKQKEKKLLQLRKKAEFKNPDEFYMGMINAKLVDGVHTADKEGLSRDELALVETRDARFIRDRIVREKRKIGRLRNSIQIYEGEQMNKQIFFIEDNEDEDIDAATQLDAEPDLVDRIHNRPRKGQLENMASITENTARTDNERKKTQRELTQRMDRLSRLERALKVLDSADAKRKDGKEAVDVANKKMAKKYNFVSLRKK